MNPIVGIGELLWDIYPDGRKVAGGAPFNFAFHCHQLGHPGVIVSRVGDDDLGCELRDEVRRLGLSDEFIQTDREHPTGTVQVVLDAAGIPTYTITENVAWDYLVFTNNVAKLAANAGAVCFGSLAQRCRVTAEVILSFLNAARRSLRVFDINLRSCECEQSWLTAHSHQAEWIKVNEVEYSQISSPTVLRRRHKFWMGFRPDHKVVLVTRGEVGCEVFTDYPRGDRVTVPGASAHVIDTVGAGDAFTAAIVCLYLEGRTLRDCAWFANHYAARVCEHAGATPRIDRREIERAAFGK